MRFSVFGFRFSGIARVARPIHARRRGACGRKPYGCWPKCENRKPKSRRAALLLEVIVALTIMVFALGMIGAQLVGGLRMVDEVDEQTVAIQLTDRILGLLELDPETIVQFGSEQTVDGEYGDEYPGWHWRATLIPVPDTEGLGQITLEILRQPDPDRLDSIEGARVVRAIRLLKAAPEPIDLMEDFGMSEEQAAMFGESGAALGLDPTQIDPQMIAQMITPETLMELMPVLMPLLSQLSGGQLPEGMAPEDLVGMLTGGQSPLAPGGDQPGGGGEADAVRDMIRSALGGQVSEDELDRVMQDFGRGTGTSGNGGRGIEDLAAERDARNGRTGFQRGGRGGKLAPPGGKGGRGG